MYILDGLKNYTLIVLDISYPVYIGSSFLVNAIYVMKNVLIGYEMREINDLIHNKKNWDQMNVPQKFFFVLVIILIAFTFLTTGLFTYWAKNKMKGIF